MSSVALWTLFIVGGEPFVLEIENNYTVHHDGTKTLSKLMLTTPRANLLRESFKDFEGSFALFTETESDEQRIIRCLRVGDISFLLESETKT